MGIRWRATGNFLNAKVMIKGGAVVVDKR